jgi:hypothetical protein
MWMRVIEERECNRGMNKGWKVEVGRWRRRRVEYNRLRNEKTGADEWEWAKRRMVERRVTEDRGGRVNEDDIGRGCIRIQ